MTEENYFYKPEDWRRVYLARAYPLTKVEFSDEEQAMIREMAHKFGYPRVDIVRQAVRDMYFHHMIG